MKRNLKELLLKFKDFFEETVNGSEYKYAYLCTVLFRMTSYKKITKEEYLILNKYINKNKPSKNLHEEIYSHPTYDQNSIHDGWWRATSFYSETVKEETITQKLLFIDKLIEEL